VFVAGLSENWGGRQEIVLSDGTWFAVPKLADTSIEMPRLFQYLEKLEQMRELSEELRVLYVAATRCRDRLFFSSSEVEADRSEGEKSNSKKTGSRSGPKKEDTTFAAMLLPAIETRTSWDGGCADISGALGRALSESASSVPAGLSVITVRWQDEGYAGKGWAEKYSNEVGKEVFAATTAAFESAVMEKEDTLREELGLKSICEDEDGAADAVATDLPTYDVPPWVPPIVGRPVLRDLFVTALLDFWECPELFYRRRVLEIEDQPVTEAAKRGELSGAVRGQLIHEAIERLLQGKDDVRAFLAERILTVAPLGVEKACELAGEYASSIERAQALGLFREIEEAAEKRFETAYTIYEKNFLITARLDCEYVTQEGRVEIADFKTDTKLDDAALNRYRKQMMLYLLVLARFHPEQLQYRARLLFTQLGRCEVIEATVMELDEFRSKLHHLLDEYELFSERFCRDDVVFNDQLAAALGKWCERRSALCPKHSHVEKVGKHA